MFIERHLYFRHILVKVVSVEFVVQATKADFSQKGVFGLLDILTDENIYHRIVVF